MLFHIVHKSIRVVCQRFQNSQEITICLLLPRKLSTEIEARNCDRRSNGSFCLNTYINNFHIHSLILPSFRNFVCLNFICPQYTSFIQGETNKPELELELKLQLRNIGPLHLFNLGVPEITLQILELPMSGKTIT